jgi:hypothetical protein
MPHFDYERTLGAEEPAISGTCGERISGVTTAKDMTTYDDAPSLIVTNRDTQVSQTFAAEWVTKASGTWRYQWGTSEPGSAGTYDYVLRAVKTGSGGKTADFPSDGPLRMRVHAKLG